jgi:uncharacterized protein
LAAHPLSEPLRLGAATINFIVRAPRQFAEVLGKLLFWCGEDKIVYGSEAPIFQPQWPLKAFWDFELPEDVQQGYGYPPLTEQAQDPGREPPAPPRHGRRAGQGGAVTGSVEATPLTAAVLLCR